MDFESGLLAWKIPCLFAVGFFPSPSTVRGHTDVAALSRGTSRRRALPWMFLLPGMLQICFRVNRDSELAPCRRGDGFLRRTAQLRSGHLQVFQEWCALPKKNVEFLSEKYGECIDELNWILCI